MLFRIIAVLPPKMIVSIIFRFDITEDFKLDALGLLLGILGEVRCAAVLSKS